MTADRNSCGWLFTVLLLAGAVGCTWTGCTPSVRGDLGLYITSAVASSSLDKSYPPEQAFDGDLSTRWASALRERQWIEGRFSDAVTVTKLVIHWHQPRAADFTVLLQRPGGRWEEVASFTDIKGSADTINFHSPSRATALRIRCDRQVAPQGTSIMEIEVTGRTHAPAPETSLREWATPLVPGRPERVPHVPPVPFVPRPPEEEEEVEAVLPPPAKPPPPPPLPKVITDATITPYLLQVADADPKTSDGMTDDEFLELVAKRSFGYFWWETNPTNGLTRDRGRNFTSSEEIQHSSIAAVGFGLAAYVIGAERGWVSRKAALTRVRRTLRTFDEGLVRNVEGFFPHFVNMYTGKDSPGTEISTIDTTLLLAGMIVAMEYFQDPEVTRRAERIFRRVNWQWARHGHQHFLTMGLQQNGDVIWVHWGSFTEGILIYPLALGSPTHPLPVESWYAIDRHRGAYEGYDFVVEHGFQSIFRFQYPALFFDFRHGTDRTGLDYFENVTLATLAMREYCIQMASQYPESYGPDAWGLGAADGPGNRYYIYGFPPGNPYSPTDGSIIPYAVAGSTPFLPRHSIRTLRSLYDNHRDAWGKYGFADCINPTQNFVAQDALGLDAGAILLGIENYRSGLIWHLFMKNRWIRTAATRMGWKKQSRSSRPIDLSVSADWRFLASDQDLSDPNLDDSRWLEVLVPDRWENIAPEFADLDGTGWYRCTFELSKAQRSAWRKKGKPVVLTMGGVDDGDETFVNGVRVGSTPPGPDSFRQVRSYRIPIKALRTGRNVIAVRVSDTGGAGGIWTVPVEIGPE